MPSANELKKARYRASAQLLEVACVNRGWTRPGVEFAAPPTWLDMGPRQRAAYCSGERLIRTRLLNQLIAEFPPLGDAFNSSAWVCLDEATTPVSLERTLRPLAGPEGRDLPLRDLLIKLAAQSLVQGPYDLRLVVLLICATRLAKDLRVPSERGQLPGLLSMRLARSLLMVSVNELFAPWAREVWTYCSHSIVPGLQIDDSRIRFTEAAFDLAQRYISATEMNVILVIPERNPPRRLSVSALRELVSDELIGFTEPFQTKSHTAMRAMVQVVYARRALSRRRAADSPMILESLE